MDGRIGNSLNTVICFLYQNSIVVIQKLGNICQFKQTINLATKILHIIKAAPLMQNKNLI